jgi:branched-chain amino acid transport system permease protein
VGIVLVYRSGRFINFAQGAFGTAAAMLFMLLVSAWHWNFWLALAAAVVAAAVTGLAVEGFVIRRFSRAPRLVLTVATIAIAQLLSSSALLLPRAFGYRPGESGGGGDLPSQPITSPVSHVHVDWFPVVLTGEHLAAVVLTLGVLTALALFFKRSRVGIAIRGAAENNDRAEQLGINTSNLSGFVWALIAVLGALGAIASALMLQQSPSTLVLAAGGAGLGSATLVRALAAAVIGRMESLPLTIAGALGIGIVEQSVFWATGRTTIVDGALFLVVVGALLTHKARRSRVDDAATSSWAATEEVRGIPHELASLPVVKRGVRRVLWITALVVIAYPWVMSPSQTSLGALYMIYGIVGISLVVLTGWGGQVSLGQFAFVAVGAVFGGAATARWGLPFPLAVLIGCLAAAAAAVVAGLPALRIRGLFLGVTTLSLAVATQSVLLNEKWFGWLIPTDVSRPVFLSLDTEHSERSFYYLCFGFMAAAVLVAHSLRRSRTGRLLIAMRDNERASQAHSINLVRTRLVAFAVSGALSGLAGVLYANHQHGVTSASFGPEQSVLMFLMAVLGGLGSVYTVLAGAVYIASCTILIPDLGGQLLAGAVGVLGVLLFLPGGLGSLVVQLRDMWLRRVASRHRILVPSLVGNRIRRGEEALVPLAPRLDELGEVPTVYALNSRIGVSGQSQLSKVWRY